MIPAKQMALQELFLRSCANRVRSFTLPEAFFCKVLIATLTSQRTQRSSPHAPPLSTASCIMTHYLLFVNTCRSGLAGQVLADVHEVGNQPNCRSFMTRQQVTIGLCTNAPASMLSNDCAGHLELISRDSRRVGAQDKCLL